MSFSLSLPVSSAVICRHSMPESFAVSLVLYSSWPRGRIEEFELAGEEFQPTEQRGRQCDRHNLVEQLVLLFRREDHLRRDDASGLIPARSARASRRGTEC